MSVLCYYWLESFKFIVSIDMMLADWINILLFLTFCSTSDIKRRPLSSLSFNMQIIPDVSWINSCKLSIFLNGSILILLYSIFYDWPFYFIDKPYFFLSIVSFILSISYCAP